ncbi:PilC/PilY family type IV pilus protein [Marinobacter sp. HL-58]|uniref:pilus assembly protein n=1 Tax=Marinobacter sp. HL-58 TaxID=1479237 RepID=UPI0006DBD4D7|nr:PilC/PilY family type IV pilus protein [Marinobacter sp. HL-58]KPQ01845.1 MAG: T4SS system pilin-associated adhesin PilY [Marinobacter sp. HL-58]
MNSQVSWYKSTFNGSIRSALLSCLAGIFTWNSAIAFADPIDIANVPPTLGGNVSPNIMFIIDDSGSMQFELPESQYSSNTNYLFPPVSNMYGSGTYSAYIFDFDDDNPRNRLFRSYDGNPFFYNPEKTYQPWFRGDRTQWDNADPQAAYRFPGRTASGTLNLTTEQDWSRWTRRGFNGYFNSNANLAYWPITYYVKKEGEDRFDKDSYIKYQVRNGAAYRTDLQNGNESEISNFQFGDTTRSVEEEIQNFANWYSYYRSRTLAARSGIGNAFSQQGEGLRVGYGRLNKGESSVDGRNTSVIDRGVRAFDGDNRETFFDRLYTDGVPNAGTPLRLALKRAGEYFERSDNQGPWGAEPGTNDSRSQLECRQSFTILMTDGYWSGGSPGVGNVDGSNGPQIDDYDGYRAESPFEDGRSNTLADVAMQYWSRDLRPDLANEVPTSGLNPAFWQHMVTFGVGLGVTGTIDDPQTVFDAIGDNDVDIDWSNPFSNNTAISEPAKVDDLLHAAVNSRGGFFSAADPDAFASELSGVLTTIVSRVENSSTAAAASSTVFRQGALSYSAGYRSTDWSGTVQAAQILSGGARGGLIWDAERELEFKGYENRDLYTHNGASGVPFTNPASLSDSQRDALNTGLDSNEDNLGSDRLAWLVGNDSANGSFRTREFQPEGSTNTRLRLLGDIIGSNPQYVGRTNYGYRRLGGTEGSSYATFRASEDYNERPDVIYVGANSGFLHAFDSLTGEELFAYMPGELLEPGEDGFAPVNELMDRSYEHRYFVDGTAAVSDVYIDGEWRTVLIGTMGAGGRTVFALDITEPDDFSENDVLWEFTHDELGYGVSDANIVRLESGRWAAVFGNGYNSESNESALFLVDVETGNLISEISTGEGDEDTPNGMSAPVVLADRTDGTATRAYAGDLLGNLWRIDLGSAPYKSEKVFTATDGSDRPQPITAAPQIAYVPEGSREDVIVVFGTGSFFQASDSIDNQVQSLYGIYDSGDADDFERDDLLTQEINVQNSTDFNVNVDGTIEPQTLEIRAVTNNQLGTGDEGWVLDLDTSGGERVISPASFPSGFPVTRVRFSTLIPETNACGGGQDGYVMDVDLRTGGKTGNAVFDLNRDGKFDIGDSAGSEIVNGIKNVVNGERISVIRDQGVDLFLESEIVDVPDSYDGAEEIDNEGGSDDDSDDDGDGGDGGCTGPLCGDAEDFRFGRQNWEELR